MKRLLENEKAILNSDKDFSECKVKFFQDQFNEAKNLLVNLFYLQFKKQKPKI